MRLGSSSSTMSTEPGLASCAPYCATSFFKSAFNMTAASVYRHMRPMQTISTSRRFGNARNRCSFSVGQKMEDRVLEDLDAIADTNGPVRVADDLHARGDEAVGSDGDVARDLRRIEEDRRSGHARLPVPERIQLSHRGSGGKRPRVRL